MIEQVSSCFLDGKLPSRDFVASVQPVQEETCCNPPPPNPDELLRLIISSKTRLISSGVGGVIQVENGVEAEKKTDGQVEER